MCVYSLSHSCRCPIHASFRPCDEDLDFISVSAASGCPYEACLNVTAGFFRVFKLFIMSLLSLFANEVTDWKCPEFTPPLGRLG